MAKNANLGSLNFELVLKDEQFNSAVKSATEAAKNLNTTLSNLLDFRKKVTDAAGVTDKLAKSLREEANQLDNGNKKLTTAQKLLRDYNREKKKLQRTFGFTDDFAKQNALLGQLSTAAMRYVSIWGAASFVRSIAEVTGEFELQRMTLRAMLDDAHAADQVYGKIWDLALKSPFNAKELVTYAKQLVAYSIPIGEIYDTTKMLADVSSGLGVGMDRLVLAYGQIRSASFLRGQEVRQLTEAGIPILEELRKQFVALGEETITVGDVFDKISNRLVPFEMVQKVFQNMTSEGGKFFNMQEKQAETLKGKIMILKDAYDKMLNSIGSDNSDMFKGAIDSITDLMRNYEKVVAILKTVIIGYGSYRAALALVYTIEKSMIAINYIKYWVNLKRAIEQTGRQAQIFARISKSLGLSLKTLAPLVGVLVAIGSAIAIAVKNSRELDKELKNIASTQFNEAKRSVEDFNKISKDLTDNLGKLQKGSQNYRDAINELNNKYGEYLPNLLTENNALIELAANNDAVTNAIYARAKAYAKEEGMREIQDGYGNKRTNLLGNIIKDLKDQGIADDVANGFAVNLRNAIENAIKENTSGGMITFGKVYRDEVERFFEGQEKKPGELKTSIYNKLHDYTIWTERYMEAIDDLNMAIESEFSLSNYKTAEELQKIEEVKKKYAELENQIRSAENTTQDEVDANLKTNNILMLQELIDTYKELEKTAGRGTFRHEIDALQKQLDAFNPTNFTSLQKTIDAIINGNAYGSTLKADSNDNYYTYAEKLRSEYEKIIKNYNDIKASVEGMIKAESTLSENERAVLENNKKLLEQETQRKDLAEQIAAALHITLVETKTGGSSGGVPEKLSMTISTLKDIYSWYEKLIAIMDDSTAKNVLASFFPEHKDIIMLGNYKEQLLALADALEVYDKKASQALRNDVNGNGIENYINKIKTINDDLERLQKLIEDFNASYELQGIGVEFDVSKAIKKYKGDVQKIADDAKEIWNEAQKSIKDGAAVNTYDIWNNIAGTQQIGENNALVTLKDSINGLAEAWVKEWAKIKGVDLENWGEMTATELRSVKEGLAQLFDSDGNVIDPGALEQIQNMFKDIPELAEFFKNSVKSVLVGNGEKGGGLLKKFADYTKDERAKAIKYYAEQIIGLADSLKKLAEAKGNDKLKGIANALSDIGEISNSIMEGYSAGGPIGAAVGGVTTITKKIIEAKVALEEFNQSVKETQIAMQLQNFENSFDFSGIFGEDTLAQMRKGFDELATLAGDYKNMLDEIANYSVRTRQMTFWEHLANGWSLTGNDDQYALIKDLLDSYGTDYSSPDSILNGLNKILETYTDMSSAERDYVLNAITLTEKYKKSLESVKEVAASLVDTMADSYVDKMIDNWYELGDATVDYADILNEVTEAYVRMWLKSTLLKKVFNEEAEKAVTDALESGDVQKFNDTIASLLEKATTLTQTANEFLAQSNISSSGTSNTLSSGIKSITEDTANLLASYLNGMRADLAMQRVSVDAIKELLTAHIPTLEDYMAQIQANTYDTAVATQNLLSDFRSMMTSEAGATAFRVFTI